MATVVENVELLCSKTLTDNGYTEFPVTGNVKYGNAQKVFQKVVKDFKGKRRYTINVFELPESVTVTVKVKVNLSKDDDEVDVKLDITGLNSAEDVFDSERWLDAFADKCAVVAQ